MPSTSAVLVAELEEGSGDGVVDDLDHAAADELFVLDEGEIGLDAGGVAVHHKADGAGGGEDGDLGVTVAVLLAEGEGGVPGVLARRTLSSVSCGAMKPSVSTNCRKSYLV